MRNRSSGVHKANVPRASRVFASTLLARLARAMEKSNVPYLLTGSDAVSYYGAPRRSDDKDLVVMTTSREDLHRVAHELQKEGFDARELEIGHNTTFDEGFRIDIKLKTEIEEIRRVRLSKDLRLNLTTAENLVLMKLDFWDRRSLDSNDAQDLMKILARQGRALDMGHVRTEAMKRRTYVKLTQIERHLARMQRRPR